MQLLQEHMESMSLGDDAFYKKNTFRAASSSSPDSTNLFEQDWYYYGYPTTPAPEHLKLKCPCIVLRGEQSQICGHQAINGSMFCRTHTRQLEYVKAQKDSKTTVMSDISLSAIERLQAANEVLHYRRIAMSIFGDNDYGHLNAIKWTEEEKQILVKLVQTERKAASGAARSSKRKKKKNKEDVEEVSASQEDDPTSQTDVTTKTQRQKDIAILSAKLGLELSDKSDINILEAVIEDKRNKELEMAKDLKHKEELDKTSINNAYETLDHLTNNLVIFVTNWPNGGLIFFVLVHDGTMILWANSLFNYNFNEQDRCELFTASLASVPWPEQSNTNINLAEVFNGSPVSLDPARAPFSKFMPMIQNNPQNHNVQVDLVAIRKIERINTYHRTEHSYVYTKNVPFSLRNVAFVENVFIRPPQPFSSPYDIYMNFAPEPFRFVLKPENFKTALHVLEQNTEIFRNAFSHQSLFNVTVAKNSCTNFVKNEIQRLIKKQDSDVRKYLLGRLRLKTRNVDPVIAKMEELLLSG